MLMFVNFSWICFSVTKYITLSDSHDELKRTARLQEERIKRLATKVSFYLKSAIK